MEIIEDISTFGSKKMTGFGSRMLANNSPLAWRGLRGITTYKNSLKTKKRKKKNHLYSFLVTQGAN